MARIDVNKLFALTFLLPSTHSPWSPPRPLLLLPCGALQLYYYRKGQLDDFREALEAVTTDEAMEAMTHGACVCVRVRA